MADKTGIEWTEATWNPTTGCDRVSPGCDHCYALQLAPRLKAMHASLGHPDYQRDGNPRTSGPGFGLMTYPDRLDQPLRWKRPRRIFVNSMSDVFHTEVSDEFIAQVWAVMALAPRHTFQILTKRPRRMRSLLNSDAFHEAVVGEMFKLWNPNNKLRDSLDPAWRWDVTGKRVKAWPLPNVHLGVSVEDQKRAELRIPALLETPAAVRWLSCEPLLGPVTFRWAKWAPLRGANHLDGLRGLDWIVVGGESGPGARPMHPEWARQLRDQCAEAGVPFLFKQHGDWMPVAADEETGKDSVYIGPDGKGIFYAHRYLPGAQQMTRVGKKAAGRVLDGRTHDEYPTETTR